MDSLFNKSVKDDNVADFSFEEFFSICLKKWSLFLVSMVVIIGIAVLYVLRQEPVYERSEEILVKDQDSGGGVGAIAGAFSSFGLVSSNTSVNNELIALNSPAVMYEVAKRLRLDMNYIKKGGFHPQTLYGDNLPFNVEMMDIAEQGSASFRIEISPDGSRRLWKFMRFTDDGKIKYDDEINMPKGSDAVKTPIGIVKIIPNPGYTGKPYDEPTTIVISKMPMQSTVEFYGDKLNGELVDREADVIGISMRDVSVQRAVDILNTQLIVYSENWVADKNKVAVATSEFIDDRLKVIQRELTAVDNNIAKYQASTGTTSLMSTAEMSLNKEAEMDNRVVSYETQLSLAGYMKDYLSNPENKTKVIPLNVGVGSTGIEEQIAAYNEILLERDNLVHNSSESNPLVVDLDKRISGMRESIMRSINNHINTLKSLLGSARKERTRAEGKMLSTPAKVLPLLSEERQQKVKENLYLYLLTKREENELSQQFTADNIRVLTPPMGSLKPVSPKKIFIFAIAFILALLVPFVWIYLSVAGDTKVRGKKDLERVRIPFAGEIPQVGKQPKFRKDANTKPKSRKHETAPLAVVESGKRDVINEAFRVIRSNIDFMKGKDKGCEVIMLTSFNPGSGKSFISYNLGLSFALKDRKVLLIDCDLRHGSSSMFVGMPSKGLTNYLTENTDDWRNLVMKTPGEPSLSVIPVGKMPPNPAELLENGRLTRLVGEARSDYDYILLDCPPVNIVADTQIVGPLADRTLFVVRAGLLEKSAVKDINEFYDEKKFRNMSLILNGTEAVHSRYYTYGNYQSFE